MPAVGLVLLLFGVFLVLRTVRGGLVDKLIGG